MRISRAHVLAALVLLSAGCAAAPAGTYFPDPRQPVTQKVSHALHRAALAGGDDPTRYSFALVSSDEALVYADAGATYYVTDGLARLSTPVVEAALAREVAHEVLRHVGKRRVLSLSMTAGFTALGIVFPGAGLADFVVNPLVVRVFSRDQERRADAKAVEILRGMGYEAPRRTLFLALQTVDRVNGKTPQAGGLLATHPPLAERLAALEPLEPLPPVLAETSSR
jgi:Zn-dependent protease with chaperone function